MKNKKLSSIIFVLIIAFYFSFSASSTATIEKCTDTSIDVSSFAQLKDALENYKAGANIVLKGNITQTDDTNSCEINIDDSGIVALDLNGYNITVNSRATKYLFNITGSAKLYFINQSGNRADVGESSRSIVKFNTTSSGAAIVKLDNSLAEVTNVNVDFIMGDNDAYKQTVDSSDTAIFLSDKGTAINIYSGTLRNSMKNGCGVVVSATEGNKNKLTLKIGGNTTVSAYKYSVSLDRNYIRSVKFGSVSFTRNGSDSFSRINVPSNASTTLKDLWGAEESGGKVTIKNGGLFSVSQSKKVTSLDKDEDLTASKQCEGWSNAEDVVILQCRAGHVKVCGTCYTAYRMINAHTTVSETGRPATCMGVGKTNGEKCKECSYSTARELPKLSHDMVYRPGVEVSCGVNGERENYFCKNCSEYYADANGDVRLDRNEIIIENNHVIVHKPEVVATCTKSGYTAGIYCETCGEDKVKQEIIPAKSHNYPTEWNEILTPTCQNNGAKIKICLNCNNIISETTPKTGHIDTDGDAKCDTCNQTITVFEQPCTCNCHAGGIKTFFFKFINFFEKLFGKNKICKCGAKH